MAEEEDPSKSEMQSPNHVLHVGGLVESPMTLYLWALVIFTPKPSVSAPLSLVTSEYERSYFVIFFCRSRRVM